MYTNHTANGHRATPAGGQKEVLLVRDIHTAYLLHLGRVAHGSQLNTALDSVRGCGNVAELDIHRRAGIGSTAERWDRDTVRSKEPEGTITYSR